ncbi:MAG TPA: hypothetical protein DDW90_07550 [Cyanobacteria bacterium UBA9971]|nr:hypothetical protein [Cyanobacteria bacterium UBA9971]
MMNVSLNTTNYAVRHKSNQKIGFGMVTLEQLGPDTFNKKEIKKLANEFSLKVDSFYPQHVMLKADLHKLLKENPQEKNIKTLGAKKEMAFVDQELQIMNQERTPYPKSDLSPEGSFYGEDPKSGYRVNYYNN